MCCILICYGLQPGLDMVQSQTYSLYAVCCNIIDPVSPDTTNLVSCIKVNGPFNCGYYNIPKLLTLVFLCESKALS
jgi:hypothetical protein